MNILVTGGAGFLGTSFCSEALTRGHRVTCIDQCLFLDPAAHPCRQHPAFTLVQAALEVTGEWENHLAGCDAVCHFAGIANDPSGDLDPAYTRRVNLDATLRLARQARAFGVARFLFTSSCSIYGAADADHCSEVTVPRPQSLYAALKLRAEQELAALATDRFHILLPRLATLFGASARLRLDLVLNTMVFNAITEKVVRFSGDGSQRRPLLHVTDAATLLLELLALPTPPAAPLNAGWEMLNLSIRDLAGQVAAAIPTARLVSSGDAPDPRSYVVDFTRLRTCLPEWRPRRTCADGIREVDALFRSPKHGDFSAPQYFNLARLRQHLSASGANAHVAC